MNPCFRLRAYFKYIMTEVTPYSTDVLGLPYWKIVLETRRRAPVAFNKNAYFTFPDPTGQVIYKVTYDDRGNGYISLNGGEDMALTAQERFIII